MNERPVTEQEHVCKLTVFPEGEALCLECGANYIYQTTITEPELEEARAEAKERGLV